MKIQSVAIVCLLGVCFGNPTPLTPKDNSRYVEGESRYIWMNDDAGVPQLVNLQEPVEESLKNELTRNGAGNRYFLYTRQNPNNPQQIIPNNFGSLASSLYSASRPLVVLSHGWNGGANSLINRQITAALLETSDVNIIVVDWQALADSNYVTAVLGTPSVGQFLGNFLVWLVNSTGSNWNNVHLVGYSLGAHVVGNAGRTAGNLPARITGLDPAGPLWQTNSNSLRASDGQYVEAIHTDGGLQGILRTVADADFYPNGGSSQPGCSSSACNHRRAYELFAATITYNHLIGRRCDNFNQALNNACTGAGFNMGNNIMTKRGSGIFGLQTGATWPY
ncbi:lipase domain-containing protein [Phthorimaea operculella]|nr:lipase domain-containing protein [Phthorimaea operculella]